MTDAAALLQALGTGPILLDFDGPVCSVFAGIPATAVAADLVLIIAERGINVDGIRGETDPLAILRWTATLDDPDLPGLIDDALTAAELNAVDTAEPTPGLGDVLLAAHEARRPVAVVSNNSAPAIMSYLDRQQLAAHVQLVVGRVAGRPGEMKPAPTSVLTAARKLRASASACVLIGDSVSDVKAALAAGSTAVGYANKRYKLAALTGAGAHAVVDDMTAVARAVALRPLP